MARVEDESRMNGDEIERELGVVDDDELREAEELAQALSRGARGATGEGSGRGATGDEASVADMVEVSALLRVSQQLDLDPARQRAIFEELASAQARKQRAAEPGRRVFRWWWLLPLPLPLAAVALLLFFVTTRPSGVARRAGTPAAAVRAGVALPEPPASLLAAQARAISGTLSRDASGSGTLGANEALALADYDRELGQYRGQWLSALQDQYRP